MFTLKIDIDKKMIIVHLVYRVFHGFGQAKFAYRGSLLGLIQFLLLPQLPLRMMFSLRVV